MAIWSALKSESKNREIGNLVLAWDEKVGYVGAMLNTTFEHSSITHAVTQQNFIVPLRVD